MTILVDVAGARVGGAKRLLDEYDAYLQDRPTLDVRTIGRGRALTADWLVRRESCRGSFERAVALNNVSFSVRGRQRTVLVHGAQHFVSAEEFQLVGRALPRSVRIQARLVRKALARADLVVVPARSMAERVVRAVPRVADRIEVRYNPVSVLDHEATDVDLPTAPRDTLLCPVMVGPHKRMDGRLRLIVRALDLLAGPPFDLDQSIVMTADRSQVAPDLADHPRLVLVGEQTTSTTRALMSRCAIIVFPSDFESFGYPLAEARVLGIPVVALDTAHNHDIAGPALVSYPREDVGAVADAILCARQLRIDPTSDNLFDRGAYFDFMLGLATDAPVYPTGGTARPSRSAASRDQ